VIRKTGDGISEPTRKSMVQLRIGWEAEHRISPPQKNAKMKKYGKRTLM
jgi:hypothetical protein